MDKIRNYYSENLEIYIYIWITAHLYISELIKKYVLICDTTFTNLTSIHFHKNEN